MIFKLKPAIAAALTPVEQADLLVAVNALTQARGLDVNATNAKLALQRSLCDLAPGPESPEEEP